MLRLAQFCVILFSLVAHSVCSDQIWEQWKTAHRKNYHSTHEEAKHRVQWERNWATIKQHTIRYNFGLENYAIGLNEFSDLSWHEFGQLYLMQMPTQHIVVGQNEEMVKRQKPLEEIDWREKGLVTNVKNQDGNCSYAENLVITKVSKFDTVHSGREEDLQSLVSHHGPVAVAIDADENFMHYRHGVFFSQDCSSTSLNHGVLLVGYGADAGKGAFWIVKNSWGLHWGEHGYVRMARNRDNMCGIATAASVPII